MALISLACPHCQSDKAVVKNGKSAEGKQQFRCRGEACQGRTFMLNPSYPGRLPAIKQQIVDMSLNGCVAKTLSGQKTSVVKGEAMQLLQKFLR